MESFFFYNYTFHILSLNVSHVTGKQQPIPKARKTLTFRQGNEHVDCDIIVLHDSAIDSILSLCLVSKYTVYKLYS